MHAVTRSRSAGERMDRIRIDLSSSESMGMDVSEYEELGELAREGLRGAARRPVERRAILLELSAFADFLVEQICDSSRNGRSAGALVASGELPAQPPQGGAQ